jgi:hypothetical protein
MTDVAYLKMLSGDADSQRNTSSRVLKVGIALIAGSCLVFIAVMATSAAPAAETTNLLGMPSLRSASPMMLSPKTIASIPGPSPWKELALAGVQASNQCGRDVSSNANPVKAVMATLTADAKMEVAAVGQSMIEQFKDAKKLQSGQTSPMGFWDPLGFSTKASGGKLAFYREAELKHGRICMLASVGFLFGEAYQPILPGPAISDLANKQLTETSLASFWVALAVATAIPEVFYGLDSLQGFGEVKQDRIPGDFGWDPLDIKSSSMAGTPEQFLDMQNKELNNGRLAMLALAGMFAQELATGKTLFNVPY